MGALVCTMLCALVARPAYADPVVTVPDVGARPVPAGPITFPGTGTTGTGTGIAIGTGTGTGTGSTTIGTATPVLGPFASQVMTEDIAVQALGEQVKQLQIDMQAAEDTAQSTEATWRESTRRVEELRAKADSAAADAYKAAAGLGPLDQHAGALHNFSILVPGLAEQPGGQSAARDLLRAEQQERTANDAYQLATSVAQSSRTKFESLDATFRQRSAALVALKATNSTEYAKAVAQTDAYEQSLGGSNLALNLNIDGMQANPKALQAVNYALDKAKTGKARYVWGTQGPDTFDCSGLAYWAYGKVGVTVPRVANAMYHGTQAIVATRNSRGDLLLPGDLVYFATNPSDWYSIYHMGIYIGGGYMVVAPTTGDVVKISPVTWSRFFGATRIFPAVPKVPAIAPLPSQTTPSHTPSAPTPPAVSTPTLKPPSSAPAPPPTTPAPPTASAAPTSSSASTPPSGQPGGGSASAASSHAAASSSAAP
jgi:cell wall-associated NlpC family hydrolase